MKRKLIYGVVCALLVTSACKKNTLPPTDPEPATPEFFVKCDVNGFPLKLEAGVNDYYMYASHYQDTNGVYVYKGELAQKNCPTCAYQIAILINDYKVSSNGEAMKPDSGLYTGRYQFNDGTPEPVEYKGTFTPIISSSGYSFAWNYSDGQSNNSPQGVRNFRAGKTYSVTLRVDTLGSSAVHTNVFRVGNPLQTNVTAIKQQGSQLAFNFYGASTITGGAHSWDFGNGLTSTNVTPTAVYASEGYYTTKLTLTNGNDICESYYQVPAFHSHKIHANYNSYFQPLPNTKRLSSITLLITDPAGKVYSSSSINQSTSSNIEITSVEDYQLNSINEPTKKLKIRFNCSVNDGTNEINVTNGEAVIAVSYK